jgi:hypothetical protein
MHIMGMRMARLASSGTGVVLKCILCVMKGCVTAK